jgi:hypothetical protein
LYVALDQGYIDQDEFRRLESIARDGGRKIGALMSYLRQSNLKGPKFKTTKKTKQ